MGYPQVGLSEYAALTLAKVASRDSIAIFTTLAKIQKALVGEKRKTIDA